MMIGKRLRFDTAHATEFVDITDRLRAEVRQARMRMGRLRTPPAAAGSAPR